MTEINKASAKPVAQSFPILGLLGVAFVVLKLCGVIGWSWWWVTVPFWGPFALVLAILFVVAFAVVVVALIKAIADRLGEKKAEQKK